MEDLDIPEGKKARLSDETVDTTTADEGAEETDVVPLDLPAEQPDPTPAAVTSVDPEPAKDSKGKGKRATKGADLSFKENPFTFLKPDDSVIQACMYVMFPFISPIVGCPDQPHLLPVLSSILNPTSRRRTCSFATPRARRSVRCT